MAAVASVAFVSIRHRWRDERTGRPRQWAALAVITAGEWSHDSGTRRLILMSMVTPKESLSRAAALLRTDQSLHRWAVGTTKIALTEHAKTTRS